MKLPFTRTWRKPKIGPDQHNPVVREATARSSGESGHYMPMRFKTSASYKYYQVSLLTSYRLALVV